MLENGFAKNPKYSSFSEIRWLEPTIAEMFGISKGTDMYDLIKNLKVLPFLKEPQATDDIFEADFRE